MIESYNSPHLTKTLKNRFITTRLSSTAISTITYGAPHKCRKPYTGCPFISVDFHQANIGFGSASHMPPTYLCFHTTPQPYKMSKTWIVVFRLGNSTSLHCLILSLQISSQKCSIFILVVHPCFYTNSKSHVYKTSCLLCVSHPFTNPNSTDSSHPSMDPMRPSKLTHPSTVGLWDRWAPRLVHSLVLVIVTPCGCVGGVIQPFWCTHVVKGRHVIHSLGMLPSHPALA